MATSTAVMLLDSSNIVGEKQGLATPVMYLCALWYGFLQVSCKRMHVNARSQHVRPIRHRLDIATQ